jgi:hypothetical protein
LVISPHTFELATTSIAVDAAALALDPAVVVDGPFDEVELHPASTSAAIVRAPTAIVPIRMRPRVVTTDSSLHS